jgi:biotin carboxylase
MPDDVRHPDRLLMVMPYHQLARKAVEAGFKVWAVWDPALRGEEYLNQVREHCQELLLADFRDEAGLRALIAATARTQGIGRVLHLGTEASMVSVAAVAEALGLSPNPATAISLLNDKAAMRELLNSHDVSVVRAERAGTHAEVRAALCALGLPAIVKPAALSGSRGVALIRDEAELAAWCRRVDEAGLPGPYIVEEYLSGPEFSVETLTVDGVHHVVGVTAKQTSGPPGFVETGHLFPAPLPEQDRTMIESTATALLDLAGYRFGPAHTEVILTPRGPRIVESQARLGGDRIPLLIETATGFDIEAEVFRALAGQPLPPVTAHRLASIGFFQLPPGELESVADLDPLRSLPDVHVLHFPFTPGDTLPCIADSSTRHGYVVVDAPTPRAAAERIAAAQSALRAEVRTKTPHTTEGAAL